MSEFDLLPDDPEFGEDFWTARDELAHVRDFAGARGVSRWAMLGAVMAHVAARTPPYLVLPPLVGGPASLNMFVGIVGKSGQGKGAAISAALDGVQLTDVLTMSAGSGEGIAHLFARYDPKSKTVDRFNDFAMLQVDEVDTLNALGKGRQGTTLLPELRKVWSGADLGFNYVDKAKALRVARHSYRLCLLVGIQPLRASALLSDADGGTPQRFLWMPAYDKGSVRVDEPDPIKWVMPDRLPLSSPRPMAMKVCDAARTVIQDNADRHLRDEPTDLDGHALLNRLKVAAVLSLFNGNTRVRDEDWDLADVVMQVSDHTREQVKAQLSDGARRLNRAQAELEAERAVIVRDKVSDSDRERVTKNLKGKLNYDWVAASKLRSRLAARDREMFDDVMDALESDGDVESHDAKGGGRQYRLR